MAGATRAGFVCLALTFGGCGPAALPPAAGQLETLEVSLGRAGAAKWAPAEYGAFLARLSRARAERVSLAFPGWPFRADRVERELGALAAEGTRLLALVEKRREASRRAASSGLAPLRTRITLLNRARDLVGGLTSRGTGLAGLEVLMAEAQGYYARDEFARAADAAARAADGLARLEAAWARELERYADPKTVAGWNAGVRDLVHWSARHDPPAIIVSKADLRLTVYQGGRSVAAYPVTLGFNGYRRKLHAGDGATPEGRYRITAKRGLGQTRYYKALMLDYPTAEDRRRFAARRAVGLVTRGAGLGGLIELHGGVADEAERTLGCIGLANPDMDAVFDRVTVGTPVAIVGAVSRDNRLARLLAEFTGGRARDGSSGL